MIRISTSVSVSDYASVSVCASVSIRKLALAALYWCNVTLLSV